MEKSGTFSNLNSYYVQLLLPKWTYLKNAYVFLIIFWNIVLTQFMQILLKCTILFPFEFKSFQVCKGFLWNRSCYVPNGFKVLLRNSKLRNCWSLWETSKIHMEDTLKHKSIARCSPSSIFYIIPSNSNCDSVKYHHLRRLL